MKKPSLSLAVAVQQVSGRAGEFKTCKRCLGKKKHVLKSSKFCSDGALIFDVPKREAGYVCR